MQIQKNTQIDFQSRQGEIWIPAFRQFSLNKRAFKFRMLILFLFELFLLRALSHWIHNKTAHLQHIEYITHY